MTEKIEDFENSTKYWICDNNYVDADVKVRNHCYIDGKCRGSGLYVKSYNSCHIPQPK